MRLIFLLFLFTTISLPAIAQQTGNKNGADPIPFNPGFDVIVSLSALNTDATVSSIKSFASSANSGLIYKGYCKNQKCLILAASTSVFASTDEVIGLLKSNFGDAVMCSKNYTVKEFYRICTFSNETEYQYFKRNYR